MCKVKPETTTGDDMNTSNENEYISIKAGTIMLLIIAIGLLFALPSFAQDTIGIDTPAVEASAKLDILSEIGKVLLLSLVSLVTVAVKQAIPLLNAYLKSVMHFRGSNVIADALTQSMSEMGAEIMAAARDGKITDEEKAALKKRAKEISESKLKNLSGFYKKDLTKWIDDVMDAELSKLLARIFS